MYAEFTGLFLTPWQKPIKMASYFLHCCTSVDAFLARKEFSKLDGENSPKWQPFVGVSVCACALAYLFRASMLQGLVCFCAAQIGICCAKRDASQRWVLSPFSFHIQPRVRLHPFA